MMEPKKSNDEFEATIDQEGKIAVPHELALRLSGTKLHVRLSREELVSELRERSVTEEEVEMIARRQLESRDQVVKFLLTEGVLRTRRAFAPRKRGKR
jgi:hypothetical protein